MNLFYQYHSPRWLVLIPLLFVLSCSKDSDEKAKTIVDESGNPKEIAITSNQKSVGDSANDLLSDSSFDTLILELFYVDGFKPTDNTIANFEAFLNERVNKPKGISINLTTIVSPGNNVYSIDDIRDLEDNIRSQYTTDKKIAVFGIFMDGEYSENTDNGSVLGVAYRNTSFVIFEETVKSFSNQPFAPSTTILESTVLNHEFGHLLGMVNAGTEMQTAHQDVENGRHCTAENCLMFWTAETGEGLLNMLSGGTIPDFDAQCIADLQANGGK
jgi:hypothetical protein